MKNFVFLYGEATDLPRYMTGKYDYYKDLIIEARVRIQKALRSRYPHFSDATEQDSHDFLITLLKHLQEDTEETKSVIDTFFETVLCNKSKCLRCQHSTQDTSTESVLSIPLKQNVKIDRFNRTIDESLSEVFATQTLELLDWRKCEKCGRKTPTERCTRVQKPPQVLVLHLQRSYFNKDRQRMQKYTTDYDFSYNISLRDVQMEGSSDANYELFGVLHHSGCSIGNDGHFTAEVKKNY